MENNTEEFTQIDLDEIQDAGMGNSNNGAAKLLINPHVDHEVNAVATQAAMVSASSEGKDRRIENLVEKFKQYKDQAGDDPNYAAIRDSIVSLSKDREYDAIKQLIGGYIEASDPIKLQKLMSDVGPLTEEIERNATTKSAYAEAVVNAVAPAPTTDIMALTQDYVKAKIANAQIIGEMFENEGIGSKVSETLGLMLIPDYTKDIADVTGVAGPEQFRKFLDVWSQYTPEEQIANFPQLRDEVLQHMEGNKRKAANFLQEFLTPGLGADVKSRMLTEGAFAAIDFVGIFKGLTAIYKGATNTVKTLKELKQIEDAAHLTGAAIADSSGNVGRAVGLDRNAAIAAAMPTKAEHLDSARFVDNINGDVMSVIRGEETKVLALTRDDAVLTGEALNPEDIVALKEKYLAKYRTAEGDLIAGLNKADFIEETNRGMKFELTFGQSKTGAPFVSDRAAKARLTRLIDEGVIQEGQVVPVDGGFAVKRVEQVRFQQNDVGEYLGQPQAGWFATHLWSPSSWYPHLESAPGQIKATSTAVNNATRAELGKHVMVNSMNRMLNAATSPLGNVMWNPKAKARLRKIDQVSLQGDAHTELLPNGEMTRGKIYSPSELSHGIQLPDGAVVKLDSVEQGVYYAQRRVADWMFVIKNKNTRDVLEFRGYKSIDVEGKPTIGKAYDTHEAAQASITGRNVERMYDPTANKGAGAIVGRQSINFKDMYDKGYRLAHVGGADESVAVGGEHFSHVWIKQEHIKSLPDTVLNYKSGYVPKIYRDGVYFAKESIIGSVNGVDGKIIGSKTWRMFDTKKDADIFVKRQNEARVLAVKLLASPDDVTVHNLRNQIMDLGIDENELRELLEGITAGKISGRADALTVVRDRELAPVQMMNESNGVSGGLFTSPRASHDILFGLNGEVPRRVGAFESMQRYTQHLSNYVPRNEWRIAEQQRWLNTAHKMNIVDREVKDFRTAVESIKAAPGSPENATMRAAARWIEDQARIPTVEERAMGQVMTNMAEYLESPLFGTALPKAPKATRDLLHWGAKHDVFAEARTFAFHNLLGWFNPAQLFVQAQGATIAMSLHPAGWKFGMQSSAALRATLTSKNPQYIAKVAKALGMDASELQAMNKLFSESGLSDSILATADHSAAAQGYGFGMSAVKDTLDKGLFFYREGELFNKTYSFSTAVHRWLEKNPGRVLATVSKKELKEIINDTMHIGLNMTSANRAHWQKGALGLPTQFMQIQAKWVEAMFPSLTGPAGATKFARAERVRAMLMQMAVYGAAGFPAGGLLVGKALEQFGVKDAGDLPPEVVKYINGGAWDAMFFAALGADVETGGRGAIVSGLTESLIDAVTNQHDLSAALGAFGMSASAVARAFGALGPLMFNADKLEYTANDIAYIADYFAQPISTWSNISKAYFMYSDRVIYNKHGQAMIDKNFEGGFNGATLIGQAMGFQPSEKKHLWAATQTEKSVQTAKTEAVSELMNIHIKYLHNTDDPIAARNAQVLTDYVLRHFDPIERRDLLNTMQKRIMNPESTQDKTYLNLLTKHSAKAIKEFGDSALTTGIPLQLNQGTNLELQKRTEGNQ